MSETLCGMPMLGNNYAEIIPENEQIECGKCLKILQEQDDGQDDVTEFIKIERIIYKRSYGLEIKDKLLKISGKELGSFDLSSEFKDQLWEDMSIDIDELIEEFGEREDIRELTE